jgi:hypothetical protein
MRIAYTALHYGSPYLAQAIRSVIDAVDKYYVLYTQFGSHGTRNLTHLPISDSRNALMKIAHYAAGDKLVWVDGDWQHEGQQRDAIHDICPEADVVLVLDYDEIWPDELARISMDYAEIEGHNKLRISMVHFWRAFNRAVLHDPAYPIRVIVPTGKGEYTFAGTPIAHMGYAIPDWLLRYKMHIHGHRAELRTDDWYSNKWLANAQEDCHPVGSEFWNPEAVNPLDYLPDWMQAHPYYGLEVIP